VTRLTFPVCAALGAERSRELKALGLETAVFGHWDAHLPLGIHIFAKDAAQYRLAKEIMARWYREDCEKGCAAIPHRGVGKVCRDVFTRQMQKEIYDPQGLFNPQNA
jgi:hypothetical protein